MAKPSKVWKYPHTKTLYGVDMLHINAMGTLPHFDSIINKELEAEESDLVHYGMVFMYSDDTLDYYDVYDHEESEFNIVSDSLTELAIPHIIYPDSLGSNIYLTLFDDNGDILAAELTYELFIYYKYMYPNQTRDPYVQKFFDLFDNWENQVANSKKYKVAQLLR